MIFQIVYIFYRDGRMKTYKRSRTYFCTRKPVSKYFHRIDRCIGYFGLAHIWCRNRSQQSRGTVFSNVCCLRSVVYSCLSGENLIAVMAERCVPRVLYALGGEPWLSRRRRSSIHVVVGNVVSLVWSKNNDTSRRKLIAYSICWNLFKITSSW